jgi:ribosome-associated translation inhibitor RaiA
MKVEFETPYGKVAETLVNRIRSEMLRLSHVNKRIKRAGVSLKEENAFPADENKVCEIRLDAYGDNLFIHKRGMDFEHAANAAMNDLRKLVKLQVLSQ